MQRTFSHELASLRRTFARVYEDGRKSCELPSTQQRTHRRRAIQSAMNDLEHFMIEKVDPDC